MKMKKITAVFFALLFMLCCAACGSEPQTAPTSDTKATSAKTDVPAETPAANGKTLVVYFSATGTTKGVAETIASVENADLYEIVPAQPYSDADLNWSDSSSRSTKEQNDKTARPQITSDAVTLDGVDTIYIGYPIWWGEEPRIMDTFVEQYSFDGITVVPFCTSGGSGIGRSGKNLAELAGSGNWLDGDRLRAGMSESDVQSWIDGLK